MGESHAPREVSANSWFIGQERPPGISVQASSPWCVHSTLHQGNIQSGCGQCGQSLARAPCHPGTTPGQSVAVSSTESHMASHRDRELDASPGGLAVPQFPLLLAGRMHSTCRSWDWICLSAPSHGHPPCCLPLPALAHASLVTSPKVARGEGSQQCPPLPFPGSPCGPAAQGGRAPADRPPAGHAAWGTSVHPGHPLHLRVHKQVTEKLTR